MMKDNLKDKWTENISLSLNTYHMVPKELILSLSLSLII